MILSRRFAGLAGILAALIGAGGCVADASATGSGPTGEAPVREIPVTLLTDASFRALPHWRKLAREAVEGGTADLPEQAGLRFRPARWLTWEPRRRLGSLAQMLDEATAAARDSLRAPGDKDTRGITSSPAGGDTASATRASPGLLAVFTAHHFGPADRREMGYAYLGRPALILVAPRADEIRFASHRGKDLAFYFRHEVGHVFGLPHMSGRNIMAERLDRRSWEFSPIALDILRAARNMDFTARLPFAGCDLETLRDAYLFLDKRGECDGALLLNLGAAFLREDRADEAKPLLEAGLRRVGDSTAGRLDLAQSTLSVGDTMLTRSLIDSLGGAETLSPAEVALLGSLRVRLGDLAQGRTLLTKALASDSTRFTSWFLRGLAYFREGDFAKARADFEKALSVEERPEAWYNLALACDAMADGEGARRALDRYLELAPDGPQSEDARKRLQRYLEPVPGMR